MAQAAAQHSNEARAALSHWQARAEAFAAQASQAPLAQAVRRSARQRLTLLDWPGKRDEVFRHLGLDKLLPAELADEAPLGPAALVPEPLLGAGAPRVVLRNGLFCADASSPLGELQKLGLRAQPMAAALAQPSPLLQKSLAFDGDALLATLNDAFLQDGVVLRVEAEATPTLEILFLSDAVGRSQHPRLVIEAAPRSRACLIERHLSPQASDAPVAVNNLTQVFVRDGAHLEHLVLQAQATTTRHAGHVEARLGRGATFKSFALHGGGAYSRQAVHVELTAPGAAADTGGLYICRGRQTHATYVRIEHAHPHGRSTQAYKGVLYDHGVGDFCGTVLVQPPALRTDARQINRNLLLSPQAAVHTRPQLLILADDVKCNHGATVGQLDENAVFYLHSRGIDAATTQRMLTYAFAHDTLQQVTAKDVRQVLDGTLRALLRHPSDGAPA